MGQAVPDTLRRSFNEAITSHEAGAHMAAALMCRKTLEAMCLDRLKRIDSLAKGLRSLRDQEIIDKRLYEWAEALRDDGNLAAHEADGEFDAQDAEAMVDFTEAILEYVYVLKERFQLYGYRRAQRAAQRGVPKG